MPSPYSSDIPAWNTPGIGLQNFRRFLPVLSGILQGKFFMTTPTYFFFVCFFFYRNFMKKKIQEIIQGRFAEEILADIFFQEVQRKKKRFSIDLIRILLYDKRNICVD